MGLKTHISVRNLSVFYGKNQALKNISVDIPDKKITVIIGPSGCGKTTLLKSFNRLIDTMEGVKVSGEVLVDGENIFDSQAEVTHPGSYQESTSPYCCQGRQGSSLRSY